MDEDITNEVTNQQNRMLLRLAYAASGTAGVLMISLGAWVVNECLESKQFRGTISQRVGNLESGLTIKMANETRTEISAIWRELGKKTDHKPE